MPGWRTVHGRVDPDLSGDSGASGDMKAQGLSTLSAWAGHSEHACHDGARARAHAGRHGFPCAVKEHVGTVSQADRKLSFGCPLEPRAENAARASVCRHKMFSKHVPRAARRPGLHGSGQPGSMQPGCRPCSRAREYVRQTQG